MTLYCILCRGVEVDWENVEPPALLICNLQFMILMSPKPELNMWSRILEILDVVNPSDVSIPETTQVEVC